jgi:hypothetical protein
MNPFRALETIISNLVEGTFGRVFRSEVRPMELARRLAREMDEHRTVSVSRVYAPNEYAVWLSPEDRALYEGVEAELIDELCAYLLEHARREDLVLASPPQIAFHTDERLALGEFGIEAKLARGGEEQGDSVRPAEAGEPVSEEWLPASGRGGPPRSSPSRPSPAAVGPAAPSPAAPSPAAPSPAAPSPTGASPAAPSPAGADRSAPRHGETLIYSHSQRVGGPAAQARAERASTRALLVIGGRRLLVPPPGAVIGRSRECDIVLEDSGVSRRHAEIRPTRDGWTIADLHSTNGVRVNGRALRGAQELALGDRIELGSTEVVFELR